VQQRRIIVDPLGLEVRDDRLQPLGADHGGLPGARPDRLRLRSGGIEKRRARAKPPTSAARWKETSLPRTGAQRIDADRPCDVAPSATASTAGAKHTQASAASAPNAHHKAAPNTAR
jgi:hypothetical protein